jgi:hypothetical protein
VHDLGLPALRIAMPVQALKVLAGFFLHRPSCPSAGMERRQHVEPKTLFPNTLTSVVRKGGCVEPVWPEVPQQRGSRATKMGGLAIQIRYSNTCLLAYEHEALG